MNQKAVLMTAATTTREAAGSQHSSQKETEIQSMNSQQIDQQNIQKSHTTLNMPTTDVVTWHKKSVNVFSSFCDIYNNTSCKRLCYVLNLLYFAVASFMLAFFLTIIMNVLVTPLLWIFILVLRLLQFFLHHERYEHVTLYKRILRLWMCLNLVLLLLSMSVIYPIAKFIPFIKDHVRLIELPITEWVEIICMLSGIYLLNSFVYLITFYVVVKWLRFPTWESGRYEEMYEAVSEAIGSLLFWWAELEAFMRRVPAFRSLEIFGLPLQKWIEVPIIIILGYNITRIANYVLVWSIWRASKDIKPVNPDNVFDGLLCKKYLVYVSTRNRMRRSITFMLTSVLGLLIWVLRLGPDLKAVQAWSVLDFGTRTWICILICSLLWVAKSSILVAWEAHAVYTKLSAKIVEVGKHFYFLGILDRHRYDIFKLRDPNNHWLIRTLKDHLLNEKGGRGCTFYDLYQVAQYLLEAMEYLSKEKYAYEFLQYIEDMADKGNRSIEETLKQLISWQDETDSGASKKESSAEKETKKNDWDYFQKLLNEVEPPSYLGYPHKKLEAWVEGSRKSCLFMANTVHSAEEVADCLNKIFSVVVIAGVFVLWLLLTRLTTREVLVLVAAPFLAVHFIFGDTCKSAFQGIMFVYVLHPFSVGDLCVIDDKMMVVNTIDVWKTTFSTVDKQVKVIYPNSELANKVIVNHKTEFDWDDCLEFKTGPLDKRIMDELIKNIELHLILEEKDKFTPGSHSIAVLGMGDDMKLVVRFKYKMPNQWTFFDCLQHKEKIRSELTLHIQNLVQRFSK